MPETNKHTKKQKTKKQETENKKQKNLCNTRQLLPVTPTPEKQM